MKINGKQQYLGGRLIRMMRGWADIYRLSVMEIEGSLTLNCGKADAAGRLSLGE